MRNLFLCYLIAGTLFGAKAQEADQPLPSRNVFKFAPNIRGYGLKFGVEHFNKTFSQSMSFLLTGTWIGSNREDFLNYHIRKGVAAETQYRKYFVPMKTHTNKGGLAVSKGVYLMGFGKGVYEKQYYAESDYQYNNGNPTFTNQNKAGANYLNFSTGLCLGYQLKFMHVMVIDVSAGAAIQFSDINIAGNLPHDYIADEGFNDPGYSGLLPKLSLLVGFSL